MKHDDTTHDTIDDDNTSPQQRRKTPKPPALEIVHQDAHLFVINKPAGMWPKHAILDEPGVFESLYATDGVDEASLANVYPLEPDVSGLMLLARDTATLDALETQYANERLTLTYLAIVRALVQTEAGTLEDPPNNGVDPLPLQVPVDSGEEVP